MQQESSASELNARAKDIMELGHETHAIYAMKKAAQEADFDLHTERDDHSVYHNAATGEYVNMWHFGPNSSIDDGGRGGVNKFDDEYEWALGGGE